MDYEEIKDIAKEDKVSVKSLLALTPSNDPFYVGSAGQMEKAKWFGQIYKLMGSPKECHIRRIHYWLVTQDPKYKKPDGTEYLNTLQDWSFLMMCAKYARYAGFMPVENMIDKRNPPAIVNAHFWDDEVPTEIKKEIDANEIISAISNKFYCFNPHNTQKYLIEIWCEKSTMNDILKPLAEKYGMNIVIGLGELSITAVYNLIKRIYDANKPVRILYISDFDPAGEGMPISVSRKIEFFLRNDDFNGPDVKLKPLMLTPEQCKNYKLPRTPIKATEGRKEDFEERHGTGATELDALEALHPGEMKKIIEKKVFEYFDVDAWNEVRQKNRELRQKVTNFLNKKVGNVLDKLSLKDFDKFDAPRGEFADENNDWLYDSDINYFEQIKRYKETKE